MQGRPLVLVATFSCPRLDWDPVKRVWDPILKERLYPSDDTSVTTRLPSRIQSQIILSLLSYGPPPRTLDSRDGVRADTRDDEQ